MSSRSARTREPGTSLRLRTIGSVLMILVIIAAALILAPAVRPDAYRRLMAWHLGAVYFGTDGVVMQRSTNDCGPAAITMLLRSYGHHRPLEEVTRRMSLSNAGVSMRSLKEFATKEGLPVDVWRVRLSGLRRQALPAILFVRDDHFIVLDSLSGETAYCRDPAIGRLAMSDAVLSKIWNGEALLARTGIPQTE